MSTITEAREQYDLGLRPLMINMYNHTAAGLAQVVLLHGLYIPSGLLYLNGWRNVTFCVWPY